MRKERDSPAQLMIEPLRVGVVDAAKMLGIGRTRMYEHIKAGAIRTVKDGDRTLITVEELRGFVARESRTSELEKPRRWLVGQP